AELVVRHDAAFLEEVAKVRLGLSGGCHCGGGRFSRYFQTYLARTSVSRLTVAPGCLKPSVVTSSVCGIRATLKRSAATSTTVRLTPSTATDPLATICAASSGGQANQTVSQSPRGSR